MEKGQFQAKNKLHLKRPVINNLGVPLPDVLKLNQSRVPNLAPQIQVVQSALSLVRRQHTATPFLLAFNRANLAQSAKVSWKYLKVGTKFSVSTLLIFGFLFVLANFQSYWTIAKYWYQSETQAAEDPEKTLLKELLVPQETDTNHTSHQERRVSAEDVLSVQATSEAKQEVVNWSTYEVTTNEPRLIIPKLAVNVPIVVPGNEFLLNGDWAGLEKQIQSALREGVAKYPGTAEPGTLGRFVTTGHSSYLPYDPGKFKNVFALLEQLVVGDQFVVFWKGDKFVYRIYDEKVVKPEDTWILNQPSDKSEAVIFTCTPVGTALNRFVVFAEQIYPDPALNQPVAAEGTNVLIKSPALQGDY